MKRIMQSMMILAVVSIIMLSFGVVAFAETTQEGTNQTFSTSGVANPSASPNTGGLEQVTVTSDPTVNGGVPTVGLPNVQIEQAKSWVDRKGADVISLLQKFVQPVCIIVFIGCGLLALLGALGNSSLVGKGIWGMVIAVLVYAVVLSAPEVLDFTNAWLHS